MSNNERLVSVHTQIGSDWYWVVFELASGFNIVPVQNLLSGSRTVVAYLHDDEDDEGDEDIGLRVLPGSCMADVLKLLGNALLCPRPIIQQSDQGLLLGQLHREQGHACFKNELSQICILWKL